MEPTKNIAVLIDGDNAQPKLIQQILEEVAKYGKATIRRIYGDWTQNSMNGWKEVLNQHSISPIQKFAYTVGKNSTDGALIIEAMDILHGKKTEGFCIVSSDSDYTGLAKRIREEGLFVMGIGEKKTPVAFVQSCEIFTFCENIIDPPKPVAEKKTKRRKADKAIQPVASVLAPVQQIIDKAFDISVNEESEVLVSRLGLSLRKIDPSFDPRTYGFKSLSQLLESLPKYLLAKSENKHPLVKLR